MGESDLVVNQKRKVKAANQKKYIKTKRDKEIRHRYIVSISGYDPHTGQAINSVRMLPTEDFLNLVDNLSYNCPLELRRIQLKLNTRQPVLDYPTLKMGAAACVPIPLMLNLLRDLKDGKKKVDKMGWRTISKKEYEKGGKGKYCMFHWGRGSSFSGYEDDWKKNNELLGMKSQELVDDFACQVIKNFRPDQRSKSRQELLEKFSVFPGCVITELAYNQRAHVDMDCWGIIVHMPLCEEGMMICIWPKDNSRKSSGKFIHLPFGSFLALPAHTVHSGIYGNKGNIRFHMLIRERENNWLADKLVDDEDINNNLNNRKNWKDEMERRHESSVALFTKEYIDTLLSKCGSVFCSHWTNNSIIK
jgi:hypothetical protein